MLLLEKVNEISFHRIVYINPIRLTEDNWYEYCKCSFNFEYSSYVKGYSLEGQKIIDLLSLQSGRY